MVCVAFIFARGGSKGIPQKNLQKLGSEPLIAHSIKVALGVPGIDKVIVSTDDSEIAKVATEYGAEVPFIRPKELAEDDSSEFEAWKHAIKSYERIYNEELDVFISLPPTSPLRSILDVESCINEYKNSATDVVITVQEASRNPYFNMIRMDKNGYSQLVMSPKCKTFYMRRQDVPKVYDVTTVAYVANPKFIINADNIFSGKVRSVIVPRERAVDIDDILDLKFAEFLFSGLAVESKDKG